MEFPNAWYWSVAGDQSRYWSSQSGAYVKKLPDDAVPSDIPTERDLTDLLARYGLLGPLPFVPERVSARRFRMQLRLTGLLNQVTAWVATQDPLVQDAFEYSGEFVRSEPMMAAGFAQLGFSAEQIDAFFVAAGNL